ncbi:hypothetical protein [Thermoactinomyces mirandus]|uniref:Uncharacterized protein n=1 Tax=Thermoactinomyces mirandus TaxID=2756294 RepID=A0A7W1XSQ2_9BACL|nr:hypothetical protein [Thermoactinomyces mirandus]MBA4602578.1 hypothetical protein [Thermoactinomyces mirandus]
MLLAKTFDELARLTRKSVGKLPELNKKLAWLRFLPWIEKMEHKMFF